MTAARVKVLVVQKKGGIKIMQKYTKWLINNHISCVDKDETCSKDKNVYWKCEVDEKDNPIRVVSDLEACKKHLKENGVNYKNVAKVMG